MDINDLRSIVTVVSLLTFAGIVVWALRRSNQARFDEAALLPFADEAGAAPAPARAPALSPPLANSNAAQRNTEAH